MRLLALAPLVLLAACSSAAPAPSATVTAPGPTVTVVDRSVVTKTVAAGTVTVTVGPPPPVAAITEGIWVVGTDIQPGTYRTIEPVTDGCYWGIYRTGTNQDDIVQNGLPTGGRPQVTLKVGQDFESKRCGSWAKVG